MSKVLIFPDEQRIRDQVGTWIARIDRGLNLGERLALQNWINENSRHREVFFELAELWDRMEVLGEIAELFPLELQTSKPSLPYVRSVLAFLLVVVSSVSLGLWISEKSPETLRKITAATIVHRNLEAAYQTAVGEQRVVTLPDKSLIRLNTATLLRVHYTDSERKVELVRGEAHFQVTKHEDRIFSVQVGLNEFRAIGTAFDIRVASDRGTELTVTEGRVQVRVSSTGGINHLVRASATQQPSATEIMVDAGKEVAIDQSTQTVERLQPEQIAAALAWQQGMIVFDAEPLEKAIRELSRYSNTHFIIAEEKTRQLPVSGYFKVGDIDGLVSALHNNFNINATRAGDTVTLSSQR